MNPLRAQDTQLLQDHLFNAKNPFLSDAHFPKCFISFRKCLSTTSQIKRCDLASLPLWIPNVDGSSDTNGTARVSCREKGDLTLIQIATCLHTTMHYWLCLAAGYGHRSVHLLCGDLLIDSKHVVFLSMSLHCLAAEFQE